jgi:hypothetical protein
MDVLQNPYGLVQACFDEAVAAGNTATWRSAVCSKISQIIDSEKTLNAVSISTAFR